MRYFLTGLFLPGAVDIAIAAALQVHGRRRAASVGHERPAPTCDADQQPDLHRRPLHADGRRPAHARQQRRGDGPARPHEHRRRRVLDHGPGRDRQQRAAPVRGRRLQGRGLALLLHRQRHEQRDGRRVRRARQRSPSRSPPARWNSASYTNLGFTEQFTVSARPPTSQPGDQSTVGPRVAQRPRLHRRRLRPARRQDARPLDGHRPRPGVHDHSGLGFALDATQAPLFLREDGSPSSSATGRAAPTRPAPSRSPSWRAASASTDGTLSSATGSDDAHRLHRRRRRDAEHRLHRRPARRDRRRRARRDLDRGRGGRVHADRQRRRHRALLDALRPTRLAGTLGLPLLRRRRLPARHRHGHASPPTRFTSDRRSRRSATWPRPSPSRSASSPASCPTRSVGTVVGTDVLNGRGFFDVDVHGADLRDRHRLRRRSPTSTRSSRSRRPRASPIDASRAPVLPQARPPPASTSSATSTAGAKTGTATLELHRRQACCSPTAAGETVPLFAPIAVTVVADGAKKVVDVPFGTLPTLEHRRRSTATDISAHRPDVRQAARRRRTRPASSASRSRRARSKRRRHDHGHLRRQLDLRRPPPRSSRTPARQRSPPAPSSRSSSTRSATTGLSLASISDTAALRSRSAAPASATIALDTTTAHQPTCWPTARPSATT